jgi:hypothetical protein
LTIGLLGLGGALAVGSVVSFVLRGSNIDTMTRDCPTTGSDGKLQCPPGTNQSEVNSARSAAVTEQALGWGLAAGGAAALGAGLWFLLRPQPASAPTVGVRIEPAISQRGGMLVVSGPLLQ